MPPPGSPQAGKRMPPDSTLLIGVLIRFLMVLDELEEFLPDAFPVLRPSDKNFPLDAPCSPRLAT